MNMSMQGKVMGNTREAIERKQQLASQQAEEYANFPREMELNDVTIPLYKYKELEILGKKVLKQRCLDLRDTVESTGCRFWDHHPHLKLNAARGEDVLLEWYINVQVTLTNALGMAHLDHAAFGAPACNLPPPVTHNKQSQQQRQQQQQQQYQQYQQPDVGYCNDFDDHFSGRSHTPRSVPQHGGFALQPPHMQEDADRFEDAARIRARNNPLERPF